MPSQKKSDLSHAHANEKRTKEPSGVPSFSKENVKKELLRISLIEEDFEREDQLKKLKKLTHYTLTSLKKFVEDKIKERRLKAKEEQELEEQKKQEEEAKKEEEQRQKDAIAKEESLKEQREKERLESIQHAEEQKRYYESLSDEKKLKLDYMDCVYQKKWNEASELLVNYISNNFSIYTTKNDLKSEIWYYESGIYKPNGKSHIKEILRRILGIQYSAYSINNVISKIEADTFIEEENFFQNAEKYPDEVPVLNGILDIKTKQLSRFTPHKIFFSKLPVKYDFNAKCPNIESFLSEVLANEQDVKVFYEMGGFGLQKKYTFEKAFMMLGNGRNGKGKSILLLKKLFGVENCCSIPLTSLTSNSFRICELFGKHLNLAGDISGGDFKDTGMFKSLTGGDLVGAKRKFLNDINFVNSAKFIFACNELPFVTDTSKGFWDRWILFEFPYTFEPKQVYEAVKVKDKKVKLRDERIIEKISTDQELSGLLNKFLEGLERLDKQKRFSTTQGTEAVKDFWIKKANSFLAFCREKLEEDSSQIISKIELRKRYSKYCKEHKLKVKTDQLIKTCLQTEFGIDERYVKDDSGSQINYWVGIRWKK